MSESSDDSLQSFLRQKKAQRDAKAPEEGAANFLARISAEATSPVLKFTKKRKAKGKGRKSTEKRKAKGKAKGKRKGPTSTERRKAKGKAKRKGPTSTEKREHSASEHSASEHSASGASEHSASGASEHSAERIDARAIIDASKAKFNTTELTANDVENLCPFKHLADDWGYSRGSTGVFESEIHYLPSSAVMLYSDVLFRCLDQGITMKKGICGKGYINFSDIESKLLQIASTTIDVDVQSILLRFLRPKKTAASMAALAALRDRAESWNMAKICDSAAALIALSTNNKPAAKAIMLR